MYNRSLHTGVHKAVIEAGLDIAGKDNAFYVRLMANVVAIHELYQQLYGQVGGGGLQVADLVKLMIRAYKERGEDLRVRDEEKTRVSVEGEVAGNWFLSNKIAGMSLYVDRFAGNLKGLKDKLPYFDELGVNFLHLMPVFESPEGESDGGYAVSDFRTVDKRFGSMADLKALQKAMMKRGMYLMIDIVLNHTSHRHEWAEKAKAGDTQYQDYFYMYDNRDLPDQFEQTMPEIFPEAAPGSFTYNEETGKWVMTVFHRYQWDLNYTNPLVLLEMMDNIFFYANLGVDILRIDAPAFIWKQLGTTCQNLPEAHTLLRLIKQCVEVSAPGMAILGEAIVAPSAIMKYFGTDQYTARECDFAYNATHMALQWDALATGDIRVMMAAQHEILQKPYGTSWITYTRCHDDIGLGYDDYMIQQAGFTPYDHRKYIKDYYSGALPTSTAKGALFSVNTKTQDARISGSLASLCGLESALEAGDQKAIEVSLQRILLMQAHSFFLGGVPMIFYGDEAAYSNDYSYLDDSGKSYDNRWMHRPVIHWEKNDRRKKAGTPEQRIFDGTKHLLLLRKKLEMVGDYKNLEWLWTYNNHIAAYLRSWQENRLFCIFNFSSNTQLISWQWVKHHGPVPLQLKDHWSGDTFTVGGDEEQMILEPYSFFLLEPA
jgi:amylosucrase